MEFGTWTDGLTMGATNAYENYYLANPYKKALEEGKYTDKELNEKVRRILRLYYRTTMNRQRGYGSMCSESHYDAARTIAGEGIVVLKNERQILPLRSDARILVVGENAIKMMTVGGGSSSLKVQKEISTLNGMRARFANVEYERGYVGDVTGNYNGVTTGQDLNDSRTAKQLIDDAVAKAREADYVVIFGGLNKSDYQDCEGHDRKEYGLPYAQDDLVSALAKANKNVVYVNISGNPVAMPWNKEVAAIVQGWFIGSEAGEALADVLSGDVNPSGKLPFTWPVSLQDVGAHRLNAFPGVWRASKDIIDEEYKEGIYVGYRGVEHFKTRPLYAFGHGLSYTTFEISGLTADKKVMGQNDKITFTATVKNTGKRAGAEVVQLYIHDVKASVDRPFKELKAFEKVMLQPGESRQVSLTIDSSALSFYDEQSKSWKAEAGDFEALVGNASDNLKQRVKFTLK